LYFVQQNVPRGRSFSNSKLVLLTISMSAFISDLLGAVEPLFSMSVKQLENASGNQGADVRLIAEIMAKQKQKTKELGLDPSDTTGDELYLALTNKARLHDEHLAKQIGGKDPGDVAAMTPLIKKAVEHYKMPKSAWVLKKSVAKRLLHDMPPPVIMKQLGHSSVDSMLKREDVAEIYGALRFAESDAWLKRFTKAYKDLAASDFEIRDIEVVQMSAKTWADLAEKYIRNNRHLVTHMKELGVVYLLPTKLTSLPGITLTTMPLVFHYINEIRLYSSFFKLQQVKPNFGKIIADTLLNDEGKAVMMAGSHVHWRIIQRYYGKLDIGFHPEVFEPHVQPEDLEWKKAEDYMYDIDPELKFWKGLDCIGVMQGKKPISFNLIDNSMSFCTGANYDQRLFAHMRGSLWNELFIRYMGQANLAELVLKQLDTSMIAPEKLRI
jgi:hypothetical protein